MDILVPFVSLLSPVCNLQVRDNWQTYVRPGSFTPVGIMIHHTGGQNDLNIVIKGRSDLPGPLANFYSDRDAPYKVTLISGGRCNHAGGGSALVLSETRRDVAPSGDAAARGLLDGPGGNGYFIGFELENNGIGQDWPTEQLESIARCCAAISKHHGWTANRTIAHREWSKRKPDPRGFSMKDFRGRVAHYIGKVEDDMPKPTDFTSSCVDPKTGGHWTQTAEGGINAHNGAPMQKNYKDHIGELGPRTFLTLVTNGDGGFIQIATDDSHYNSKDWT